MNKLNVFITVVSSIASVTAWAGVVTFHPESAIYAGNGCPQGSTRITTDDFGDLLIEHDELSLSLPGGGHDHALSGRVSCAIRVPLTIPRGFYVKSIEQRLIYSVVKSANAEIRASTRTALSGDSVNPYTVVLPRGDELFGENFIDSRRDRVGTERRRTQYCDPERSEETMLQINVAITGQRDSIYDDLMIAAGGGYFGEGFEMEIEPCP